MSGIMKVFLLLAVMFCISKAQFNEKGQQCLCQRVKNGLISKSAVKDVQIYQATIFCTKVEIVVTNNNGYRYCLNPQLGAVKKLMNNILRKQRATTVEPTELTSSASSTITARN